MIVAVCISGRDQLLGKHQHIPRPRHIRPVAVEISYQSFHIRPLDRTIERGLIRELIHRLMQRRLGGAPVAPCLTAPNDFTASGRCSREYQASNASRLAGSATVARTTKKAAGMFLSLELFL